MVILPCDVDFPSVRTALIIALLANGCWDYTGHRDFGFVPREHAGCGIEEPSSREKFFCLATLIQGGHDSLIHESLCCQY